MAKSPKQQKRDFANAQEAITPKDDALGKNSAINTEEIPNNSVNNTHNKAVRITYSLYPRVIAAVEKYAEDNFMSKSQVISQALINFIPEEYFDK